MRDIKKQKGWGKPLSTVINSAKYHNLRVKIAREGDSGEF
jgi:hypothetical protein